MWYILVLRYHILISHVLMWVYIVKSIVINIQRIHVGTSFRRYGVLFSMFVGGYIYILGSLLFRRYVCGYILFRDRVYQFPCIYLGISYCYGIVGYYIVGT